MTVRTVTSLTNPTVKAVRALHQRKDRQESGLFLVEGLRSISEAVDLGRRPKILLHAAAAHDTPRLRQASGAAVETLQVSEAILAKVSRKDNPQMVLAVFEQATTPLAGLDPASASCFVGLEAVRDPGNLGTIVRTADAAGCGAVILIGDCCDPFSVEAVRATMGSIFAVPLVQTTREAFLTWRRGWPGAVSGALLSAQIDYRAAPYRAPNLLLMGNEQAGLTPELAAACDLAVKIPMRGRADSLNLAVATALMIYATLDR
ncbi:MAG TPA: RNA methyltransferase [Caulobacteraceae bacterium]|jgi:TrmH family RNA methyltransferase|nr:RNA methyltransferase [Caulobacteraceae bacterium]